MIQKPAATAASQPSAVNSSQPAAGIMDTLFYIASRWRVLAMAPLIAGLAALGASFAVAPVYTSTSTLMINDLQARAAESLMRSPAVIDRLIAEFPDLPGATTQAKRRRFNARMRLVVTPGDSRRTASIFYLQVDDRYPERAQKISTRMLDSWLDLVQPRPAAKLLLREQIEANEANIKETDRLAERLGREAGSLILPNSQQGELATAFQKLRAERDRLIDVRAKLTKEMVGLNRDVILTQPDLPTDLVWPRKGMLTVVASGLMLLLTAIYLAGRRAYELNLADEAFRRAWGGKT